MVDDHVPGKPIYYVKKSPEYSARVSLIARSTTPVMLSLVMQDHQAIGLALQEPQQGANLAICMQQEEALEIFVAIRKLARTMDWPLPKEDENLA
jgi:hypothetical protein